MEHDVSFKPRRCCTARVVSLNSYSQRIVLIERSSTKRKMASKNHQLGVEVASAARVLKETGVEQPSREAASLMSHILKKDRAFLYAHPEYELTDAEASAFAGVLGRRAAREPLQYIVGRQEFYGLDFEVVPGVLIPRPETELLVETAVSILSEIPDGRFLEAGVGSGCISISALVNVAGAAAVASDISEVALMIANRNAVRHGVADRLTLERGDLFAGITEKFDLIVSNPPYIPLSDQKGLQPEVGIYEPPEALFGGADGLEVIRRIIIEAPSLLKSGGHLLLEIGRGQAEPVRGMFDAVHWAKCEILTDLQQIPRTVVARSVGRGRKI